MKYTVMGFSQRKLCEMGLDLTDAMILRWLVDFYHTGKMMKVSVGGTEFVYVNYKHLISDIPIIGIKSKDALRRRMLKLVNSGLIESHTVREGGTFSYYRITEMYESIVSDSKYHPTTQESYPYDSKVVPPTTQKSEQIDPSTKIDQSTIHQKETSLRSAKKKEATGETENPTEKEGATNPPIPPDPPSSCGRKSKSKKYKAYPADFERWYELYTRKIKKAEAFKAWQQTEDIRPPLDELCKITIEHNNFWISIDTPMTYIPHPATWLRGRRWDDELYEKQESNQMDEHERLKMGQRVAQRLIEREREREARIKARAKEIMEERRKAKGGN